MEALFSFFKVPFVQSVLWAIALVAATAFVSRLVSQALRHFLNRDSNPLPSSSIIINIGRGVIWATGISLILDACFGINANAIVAALGLNRDSNPLPSSSIIINIGRGVIWATGISLILDACFGINANAIVAALGVGGIAVSLGFQDTLANLIGSRTHSPTS